MFKLDTNKRFRHVIRDHILSWTVFDLDFIPVNQVSNIEELDMEMMCTLPELALPFSSNRIELVLSQ
jgi:hypothetical protein